MNTSDNNAPRWGWVRDYLTDRVLRAASEDEWRRSMWAANHGAIVDTVDDVDRIVWVDGPRPAVWTVAVDHANTVTGEWERHSTLVHLSDSSPAAVATMADVPAVVTEYDLYRVMVWAAEATDPRPAAVLIHGLVRPGLLFDLLTKVDESDGYQAQAAAEHQAYVGAVIADELAAAQAAVEREEMAAAARAAADVTAPSHHVPYGPHQVAACGLNVYEAQAWYVSARESVTCHLCIAALDGVEP